MQAGAHRVREGEVRVGRDRLLQSFLGTGPSGEKEVDTLPVALGREVGGGREWQAAAVETGHGRSLILRSR
jgi:hypothetical protein